MAPRSSRPGATKCRRKMFGLLLAGALLASALPTSFSTAVSNTILHFCGFLMPAENCPIIKLTVLEKSASTHQSHICRKTDLILIDISPSLGLMSRKIRDDFLQVIDALRFLQQHSVLMPPATTTAAIIFVHGFFFRTKLLHNVIKLCSHLMSADVQFYRHFTSGSRAVVDLFLRYCK